MMTKGKSFLALVALAFALNCAPFASGQTATFSFNDGSGTANAGSYSSGSSFTFSITLNFVPGGNIADLNGFSYWLEQQNPNSPFNFAITNRDVSGSQFTFLQTPGLTYPQNMTPQNANDLGASVPGATGVGAGNYFIANLTISISASALPGTYLIENITTGGKTAIITDDFGNILAIPQSTYSVTVVPEPGSLALLLTGICLSGFEVLRQRANRRG